MRVVISFILAIFVAFFSGLSVAKSTLSLYAAKSGSVAITTVDSHVSLLALAGGYDNGQSTAGSCVIAANLNRRDSGFTGTLSPINTDINSYTDTQARGKKITIDSGPDDIVIADVDSDGICALNNGLINSYKKLSSGTGQEFSTYLELIELANTDALFLFKEHKLPQAIIRLAPYADNYRVDWLRSGESSKRVVVSALNDYAYFLQENNRMAESIPFYKISYLLNHSELWLG